MQFAFRKKNIRNLFFARLVRTLCGICENSSIYTDNPIILPFLNMDVTKYPPVSIIIHLSFNNYWSWRSVGAINMYTMYIKLGGPNHLPYVFWISQSRRAGKNTEALTSCEMGSQSVQALLLLKHLEETQASSGDDAQWKVGEWLSMVVLLLGDASSFV